MENMKKRETMKNQPRKRRKKTRKKEFFRRFIRYGLAKLDRAEQLSSGQLTRLTQHAAQPFAFPANVVPPKAFLLVSCPPHTISPHPSSTTLALLPNANTMANIKAPGAPEPGTFLFTSESVNEGHPDKICDQVSDAVLDACLREDERSRVACETCTKTGMVMIFGEITTNAIVNYEQVIRDALKDIGYDDTAKGLDYKTCNVVVAVEEQSPDIAQSVDSQRIEDLGAGDQGIMFGYATDETASLMPLSHELATQIGARLTEVRKKGICEWCRPDGKTQVRAKIHGLK